MKTFLIRVAAVLVLSSFSVAANAATLLGTFLDAAQWTLIHAGAEAGAAGVDPDDFLRFDPGQQFVFDLTGTTLTAGGPQGPYTLSSDNGATAVFVLTGAFIELSGPNNFLGGTLDYELDGVAGTFTFSQASYGSSPFNSSNTDGGVLTVYAWGGDTANDIGIDLAFSAPVPIPAPLLLFASGILGLGLTRRRK